MAFVAKDLKWHVRESEVCVKIGLRFEKMITSEEIFIMKPTYSYSCISILVFLFLVGAAPTSGIEYLIPTDSTIGTWDPVSRTYTLTADVSVSIELPKPFPQLGLIKIVEDNLTLDGDGHTVMNTIAGGCNGIYLYQRTDVTIKNLTVKGFYNGIFLGNSSYNTLTGVTAEDNVYWGFYLSGSSYSAVTNNIFSGNYDALVLGGGNNNVVAGNTISNNSHDGIYIFNSDNNTLIDNSICDNNIDGIAVFSNLCHNNNLIGNTVSDNTTGIYVWNDGGENTIIGNTILYNVHGIQSFVSWGNNVLADNTVSYNVTGIAMSMNRSNNTLEGNIITNNYDYAIRLRWDCSNNTVIGNTVSDNGVGIYLLNNSNDNLIYNNNFAGNTIQAYISSSNGNLFNLGKPTGGNFWSNWTSPDNDRDGFVDYPYFFIGGQDNLPWTDKDGWLSPKAAIRGLIYEVEALNLPKGIINNLNAKLEAALRVIDDLNENNNAAAVNLLEAFINAVGAQRGRNIPQEDADALIAAAQGIINQLATE